MSFARWPTLLLAAAMDSPALWQAFVTHEMAPMTALTRYLIALVVAAVMLAMLKSLAAGYLKSPKPQPERRATDKEAPATASI